MKPYTYSNLDYYYKYPIISKETGKEYLVKIYLYGLDSNRYSEGCVVALYKKKWIFKKKSAINILIMIMGRLQYPEYIMMIYKQITHIQ